MNERRAIDGALDRISAMRAQRSAAIEELEQIREDYPYFAAEVDRVENILLAPVMEEP